MERTTLRKLSLNTRLWLALAICILPLFVLTLYDYQSERKNALREIEHKGRLILNGALIAEAATTQQVEMTLRMMAGANDLLTLNPAECSALAVRLLAAHPDLANLGAVTVESELFCSAIKQPSRIMVSDREWFREAQNSRGLTRGQFLIGRVSKQAGVTFGYPLRDASGNLRAILFAASSTRWFDRFTHLANLPEGWNSLLVTRAGQVLSRFPEPDTWRGKSFSEESRQRFQAALAENRDTVIMQGLDGIERLYVMAALPIARDELIALVAIPTHATLAMVEKSFYARLLLLLALTACSLLLTRRLLRELVDRSFSQTMDELKRLRDALDHVPAYVYMKDKAHRYIYANRKTLEFFGISKESLADSTDERFFPPETAAHLRGIDQKVFAGRNTDEIIDVTDAPEGRRILHEIKAAIFDGASDELWGLCGISTDITEHYLAEESLRKFSRAIEQSQESIVFTNLAAEIEYVNDAFLRVTGYPREEVIGQNPRILQSGHTPPEVYTEMWATLASGHPWRGEFYNKRKDGSEYLEMATISPIRQADGRITHYVAIKVDITQQRQDESELADYRAGLERLVSERTFELAVAKEAAERANKAKSAFLANMSHEIRTPMNVIIGLNYLLLQEQLRPEQAEKVQKVSQAAEHLLQIINDILDLSKIEAGKLQLENVPFSPKEVIQSVAAMIRERATEKGIALELPRNTLPGCLLGDATRLRQILLNFASNALKFTALGSITLSARCQTEEDGTLACHFAVSDTGIGIRPDQIPRLFSAFEQLENSTTRRFGGTGLGLVIARHLSRLMGGEVGVDSVPGVGSTFWVRARFAACTQAGPAQDEKPELAKQLSGRVLLAEDEPTNQEIASQLLRSIGLQVQAVDNGRAAVDQFLRGNFDLILMDMQMPLLDGIAATTRIRSLPGGKDIPIIALTANAFAEDRQLCMQAGMTDFIAKPVSPDILYRTLACYLSTTIAQATPCPAMQPSPRLDQGEFLSRLRELGQCLANGNVKAKELHAQIRESLQARAPEEAGQLAALISSYDYEPARSIIEHLLLKLGGRPSASAAEQHDI